MAVIRPEFAAASQDTVVVITHFVEYDVAVVTTRLTADSAPAITESSEKIRVAPDADGRYTLTLSVPEKEVGSGPWVVTVLLPVGAEWAGNDPEFDVVPGQGNKRTIARRSGGGDPDIPIVWQILHGR